MVGDDGMMMTVVCRLQKSVGGKCFYSKNPVGSKYRVSVEKLICSGEASSIALIATN